MVTICAPATNAGRAAVAVLRVSGDATHQILSELAGTLPPPRRASVRTLRNASGNVLDKALVLWLPGPASYTGEDCAELHLHGGRAVLQSVMGAVIASGARAAEPGEFTRRAFLNGKMDLLEAEAVADLIAADTELQQRQALEQLVGAQSALLLQWADRLRRALAWQEALIDFPDEDLPPSVEADLLEDIGRLSHELRTAAADVDRGARIRDGIVVAVIGPPNVGKSSLVNALAERDVAITAPSPGTTRDTLEVRLEIAGMPVTLIDTAGLRDTDDPVEAEGIRRARARGAAADIVIQVTEAGAAAAEPLPGRLHIANKTDQAPAPTGWLGVSAMTGEGVSRLRETLADEVRRLTDAGPHPLLSRARHEAALREAAEHLARALSSALPELRGEDLRLAMRGLGRITGAVGAEDILDTVFGAFCIGK